MEFHLTIETEKEDGRWIAEVSTLPAVMAYGAPRGEALARVQELAPCVPAKYLENGEPVPGNGQLVLGGSMSRWPSSKARRILAVLLRIGWNVKRHKSGSHRVLNDAPCSRCRGGLSFLEMLVVIVIIGLVVQLLI